MTPARQRAITAIIIFAAALAIRLAYTDLHAARSGDEGEYHLLAVRLLEGSGFTSDSGEPTAWRTPGYPAFLASIYFFTSPDPVYGRLAGLVFSALTACVIYLFAYRIFGWSSLAIAAATLWALMSDGWYLAGSLSGETLGAFLFALGLLVGVAAGKATRLSYLYAVMAGLFVGAAILTRGYLVFALVALPAWLILSRKRPGLASVCLLFSLLLPAGWIVRNAVFMGVPTLSTETAQVVWHGNNQWSKGTWNGGDWESPASGQKTYLNEKYPGFFDRRGEIGRSAAFRDEAVAEITQNPGRVARLVPRKVAFFLTPYSYMGFDWIYAICLPLGIFGAWALWRKKDDRHALVPLIVPVAAVCAVCIVTFGDPRFRFPVNLSFAILAAVGILALAGRRNAAQN